jgi:predicted small lipoprotein YifL
MRFITLVVAAVLLAAGCGQRGPLYLRDKPPPGVKPPKPKAQQPLPYPADTDDGAAEKK